MKRILLVLGIVLFTMLAKGQVLQSSSYFRSEFGFKAGINLQSINGVPWKSGMNSGILFGVYKDFLRSNQGWRIEAFFTQGHYVTKNRAAEAGMILNAKLSDTLQKGDFNVFYLRIPILAEFKIIKHYYFLIGPEISEQLSIVDNNNAFTNDYGNKGGLKSIFKSTELMGVVCLEDKIKEKITLAIRYSLGMTSVNKGASNVSQNNFRNYSGWDLNSLQATVSFRLKYHM